MRIWWPSGHSDAAGGCANVGIGDEIIGLTPALLISVAPSGMPLPDGAPVPMAPTVDVDAVPAALFEPHGPDELAIPELIPYGGMGEFAATSNVESGALAVLFGAVLAVAPVPRHGLVLVVGLSGMAPRAPDESSVLPTGAPTPLTLDGALGTLRGEVVPIAGAVGAI